MTEGIDFSYARPGGAAIVAAGKSFVVRYIRPGDGRGLTAAEIADYRAHGLAIALVFESAANRALDGFAAGISDARVAVSRMAELGIPDIPVYFAVDFNAQTTHQAAIDNYLKGAASVIGLARVGVYGGGYLLVRCRTNKTASWFWQCASTSWGPLQNFAHLHQYRTGSTTPPAPPINGGAVDLDQALQNNYGQWNPPISAGGMQTAGEPMITCGGLTLTSSYTARVIKDTPLLKGVGDPLGATAKAGYVYPYMGIPDTGNGLRAVLVQTAIPFADSGVRPCILYVATADVAIEAVPVVAPQPPAPDTTPFAQADIDKAVADAQAAATLALANAQAADAAALDEVKTELASANAELQDWKALKSAFTKLGL